MTPRAKTELAIKTYLENGGISAQIFTSHNALSAEEVAPRIEVVASDGTEKPEGLGNWTFNVSVTIHSSLSPATDPDNAATTHDALVEAVFDLILVDDLEAQLTSALADFHVLANSIWAKETEEGVTEQSAFDALNFPITIIPQTINLN